MESTWIRRERDVAALKHTGRVHFERESITYSPKDKEKCDSKTTWGHTGLVPRKKHRLRPLFCGFPGKGLQQGREVKMVYNWIFLCMLRIEACMHACTSAFVLSGTHVGSWKTSLGVILKNIIQFL